MTARPHIILLGDSVFDNRAYTGGQPDVISHLHSLLPQPWRATLRAVDGAITGSMTSQVASVPSDATHLIVSIGGNDALSNSDLLRTRVSSTAEALSLFATRVERFEEDYRAAVDCVLKLKRETVICTIYNGNLEADVAPIARIALTTFNDVILRVAVQLGLTVLDLRLICSEPADYANPIEPSGSGGRKIAEAVARAVGALEGHVPVARVFGATC